MYGNIVQVCLCSWDSNMVQDIPASNSFANPSKTGFLHKLVGRGWLYSGSWKKRYCILDGSKFYFYESEQSKGSEKSSGVINLDYYDLCEENNVKDKKNPHVFVIGTSVRGFFDNRHQFSAGTSEEMQSWIKAIQRAIEEARNSRRKPGRKRHLEEKSPDLSTSSQESEGTSTACLVNATKDRARGPQGRRLPQRKSMMPTSSCSENKEDQRQRSISLSSPREEGEDEDSSPQLQSPSENKWLSLSLEEVDRQKEDGVASQRSSSTFDIPQQKEPTSTNENGELPKLFHKRGGPKMGNLFGQHAALTKELEMKLKAGLTPGARRRPSESDEDDQGKDEAAGKRMESLAAKVELATDNLNVLEERVGLLTSKVEANAETSDKATSQVGDVLLQVTVTLKEAERINEECKRALAEANKARTEYQFLAKECKDTLGRFSCDSIIEQHGT